MKKLSADDIFTEIDLQDDEYLADGVIYCKKCKTARSISFAEFGKSVRVMCDCQSEEWLRNEENQKRMKLVEEYKKLIASSFLMKRFKDLDFESLDLGGADKSFLELKKRCEDYVENWEQVSENGFGFYIYGDSGVGKTALTVCLGKKLITQGIKVMFTSFVDFIKRIQGTYGAGSGATESDIVQEFVNVPLLIIDDLGAERLTDFQQETIYYLIDTRYKKMLPTIFTSNYSVNSLVDYGLAKRTVDRINEMATAVFKLNGESYRKKIVGRRQDLF